MKWWAILAVSLLFTGATAMAQDKEAGADWAGSVSELQIEDLSITLREPQEGNKRPATLELSKAWKDIDEEKRKFVLEHLKDLLPKGAMKTVLKSLVEGKQKIDLPALKSCDDCDRGCTGSEAGKGRGCGGGGGGCGDKPSSGGGCGKGVSVRSMGQIAPPLGELLQPGKAHVLRLMNGDKDRVIMLNGRVVGLPGTALRQKIEIEVEEEEVDADDVRPNMPRIRLKLRTDDPEAKLSEEEKKQLEKALSGIVDGESLKKILLVMDRSGHPWGFDWSVPGGCSCGNHGPRKQGACGCGGRGPQKAGACGGGGCGPQKAGACGCGDRGPQKAGACGGGGCGPQKAGACGCGNRGPQKADACGGGGCGPQKAGACGCGNRGPQKAGACGCGSRGPQKAGACGGGGCGPQKAGACGCGNRGPQKAGACGCGSRGPQKAGACGCGGRGPQKAGACGCGGRGPQKAGACGCGNRGPQKAGARGGGNRGPQKPDGCRCGGSDRGLEGALLRAVTSLTQEVAALRREMAAMRSAHQGTPVPPKAPPPPVFRVHKAGGGQVLHVSPQIRTLTGATGAVRLQGVAPRQVRGAVRPPHVAKQKEALEAEVKKVQDELKDLKETMKKLAERLSALDK